MEKNGNWSSNFAIADDYLCWKAKLLREGGCGHGGIAELGEVAPLIHNLRWHPAGAQTILSLKHNTLKTENCMVAQLHGIKAKLVEFCRNDEASGGKHNKSDRFCGRKFGATTEPKGRQKKCEI